MPAQSSRQRLVVFTYSTHRVSAVMIGSIVTLLVLQLVGTVVIRLTGIPLPGPVVGMLILFAYLLWRGATPKPLERTAQGLLQNLALLFVPAGVGVITYLNAVANHWAALTVTLLASAAITIVVTAGTLHWLMTRRRDNATDE